jgi:hypothetical protein
MELATGSTFDPEKLTALSLAQQLLVGRELRWRDVLGAEPAAPEPVRHWKQVAREIFVQHQPVISDWEKGFLQSLIFKMHRLSTKQAEVLGELCDQYNVARWSAAP